MKSDEYLAAGEALFQAEQTRTQISLLSAQYDMDMDHAYAVQDAFVALKLATGRRRVGWKIGLTSKAMQSALNIDIPDSGVLLDDMLFEDGAKIPQNRFIEPRIEAEIAFIMGKDLQGDTLSEADILNATEYVAPAIEILDTRIMRMDKATGKTRTVYDTISDNAANAGVVLGKQRWAAETFDLRYVGAIVSRNGEVEETGLGAGVLNNPATSMLWLAKRMAQYGQYLRKGDIVLSGSFIRPIECPPGASINADFGKFGSVTLEFE